MSALATIPRLSREAEASLVLETVHVPRSYRARACRALERGLRTKRLSPGGVQTALKAGDVALACYMASSTALPSLPALNGVSTPQMPVTASNAGQVATVASIVREMAKRGLVAEVIADQSANPYGQLIQAMYHGFKRLDDQVTEAVSKLDTGVGKEYCPLQLSVPMLVGDEIPRSMPDTTLTLMQADTPFASFPTFNSEVAQQALIQAVAEVGKQSNFGLFLGPDDSLQVICGPEWESIADLMPHARWEGDVPVVKEAALHDYFMERGEEIPEDEDMTLLYDHLRFLRNNPYARKKSVSQKQIEQWKASASGSEVDLVVLLQSVASALKKNRFDSRAIAREYEGEPLGLFLVPAELERDHLPYFSTWFDHYGQNDIVCLHLSVDSKNPGQFLDLYRAVLMETSLITIAMRALAFNE